MKPPIGESAPFMLEDATSLRSVDLELTVGIHGYKLQLNELGPAILGVSDTEYANLAHTVEDLKPERGDVFAAEGMRCERLRQAGVRFPSYDEQVAALLLRTNASSFITPALYPNSYVELKENNPQPIHFSLLDAAVCTESNPPVIARQQIVPQMLEDARLLQITDPQSYAQLLASLRGVKTAYVDSDSISMERLASIVSHRKRIEVGNGYIRNMEIVQGLNRIASQMIEHSSPNAERPRLVYAVGNRHREPLSEILDKNQVPYTVSEFSDGSMDKALNLDATGFFAKLYNRYNWRVIAKRQLADWKANAEAFREYRPQIRTRL